MTSRGPARWKLLAAFAAVYLIWGSTFLAIRIAVRTIPPFLLGGTRFLLAGALLWSWAEFRREPRATPGHWRSALLTGLLLLFGGNAAVVWSAQYLDSGLIALFAAMIPLWMALLQALGFGGRKPSALTWAGLALGFAGIVVLARPGGSGGSHLPIVLVLAAGCFSWALGSLLAPRFAHPASPARFTAMQMLCGGAGFMVAALLAGQGAAFDPARVTGAAVAGLLYLAVFGSIVAFSAYVWLLRVCPPTLVGTYAFVNPVVAVILGALLAGERLDARVTLAGGLIVAAVAMLTLAPGRGGAPPRRGVTAGPEAPPAECCKPREPSF